MTAKRIICSWDFALAVILTLVTARAIPNHLNLTFCLSFYSIGITVLSIVFSIFFAALAVIMASSDNDFIEFLEEKGDFSLLLSTFRFTLLCLFISLVYSISLYTYSEYILCQKSYVVYQNRMYFLIFELLFSYSLFSTGLCVKDTIEFSRFRSKFLQKKNKDANGH